MRHASGLLALAMLLSSPAQGAAHLQTQTLNGTLAVETWKARRDARVVKQDADYSCGAASLATLLTHYYGRPTTEKDILDLLTARAKDKAAASFEDMAAILPALGFRGIGLALSPEQLSRLKMPVIVFVRARKEDHFAVLAGVGPERVKLADPALGNRSLSWRQFLERWDTRADAQLKGRALAVLPLNTGANTGAPSSDFFTPAVANPLPVELLTMRRW